MRRRSASTGRSHAGCIARVVAGDRREHVRAVLGRYARARRRSPGSTRTRSCPSATRGRRSASVPVMPRERGRLADRAAGVGAGGERHDAGGDGGSRAAATIRRARASRSQGLRTGPKIAVLVRRTHRELVHVRLADRHRAGARRARSTTVASYGGTKLSSIREPQVVRIPFVQKYPCAQTECRTARDAAPRASARSARSAAASACPHRA